MSTTARHLRGSVNRGGRVGSVNNLSQRIVLTSACQGELEQRPKSKKTGQPEERKIVQTPQKEGHIGTYFVLGEKLKWRCVGHIVPTKIESGIYLIIKCLFKMTFLLHRFTLAFPPSISLG